MHARAEGGAEDGPLLGHVYKLTGIHAHVPKVVSRSCLGSRTITYQALSIAKIRRAEAMTGVIIT